MRFQPTYFLIRGSNKMFKTGINLGKISDGRRWEVKLQNVNLISEGTIKTFNWFWFIK